MPIDRSSLPEFPSRNLLSPTFSSPLLLLSYCTRLSIPHPPHFQQVYACLLSPLLFSSHVLLLFQQICGLWRKALTEGLNEVRPPHRIHSLTSSHFFLCHSSSNFSPARVLSPRISNFAFRQYSRSALYLDKLQWMSSARE